VVHAEFVCFGCLHDAVDDGAGFCAGDAVDVHPVLAAYSERTDCSLGGVVVHGDIAILEEDSQVLLLVDAVLQRFGSLPMCGHIGHDGFCPRKEGVHLRLYRQVTLSFPFSFGMHPATCNGEFISLFVELVVCLVMLSVFVSNLFRIQAQILVALFFLWRRYADTDEIYKVQMAWSADTT